MKLNNSLKSLMALALVFGLTACQTPTDSTGSNGSTPSESTQESSSPSVHEHTFADEWSKDDTHHWKAPTCGHADAVEKVAHAWGEGEVTTQPTEESKGVRTFTCVCGATKTEEIDVLPHTHKFAEEWSKDETHHWKASTCGHADAETKAEHAFGEPNVTTEGGLTTSTWTCTECGYEKVENETSLIVNYKYANGEKIETKAVKVAAGETYSVESPAINFMAPDKAVVEGTMDADGEVVDVVYNYSNEPLSNPVPGYRYDKLMVDETKGLSFTMTTNGANRDWEEMIAGDTFVLFAGCLRYRDSQWPAAFSRDWYDGDAAVNGFPWDALLTRNDRNEIVVTWSINPNGTITAYKNGVKALEFTDAITNGGFWNQTGMEKPNISALVEGIYAEVAEKGFRMGAWRNDSEGRGDILSRNLTVGYAVNDEEAKALADSYTKTTSVKMVDENGNAVRRNTVFRDQADAEIKAPYVEGYNYVREEKSEGAVTFVYAPIGEERITEEMKSTGANTLNHNDKGDWFNIPWFNVAENLTGDFQVVVNMDMQGGNDVWKTAIPVFYDSTKKENNYMQRFDWCGYTRGTWVPGEGKPLEERFKGEMWVDDPDWFGKFLSVTTDANVNIVFTRKANTLSMRLVLTAKSGQLAGQSFQVSSVLQNAPATTISIAITAEFSSFTVNSVKY